MTSFLLTIFLIVFGGPVLSRVEFEQTNSRSCVHQGTLDAIVSNFPWGTGLGTFQDVFPIYRPAECGGLTETWHRAHNSFLELTLANGIVGPVVVISLLGAIFYQGFVILRPCSERQFTPVILLSMLIYLILHSMVDFPLQIPGVVNYVAVMTACAIGLLRRD
jgi:O-antigen ligase